MSRAMSEHKRQKTWREEPMLATLAFLLVFSLSMFIGVSVLAGAAHLDPRAAAIDMLIPAVLISAAAAAFRPTRRFFSSITFI